MMDLRRPAETEQGFVSIPCSSIAHVLGDEWRDGLLEILLHCSIADTWAGVECPHCRIWKSCSCHVAKIEMFLLGFLFIHALVEILFLKIVVEFFNGRRIVELHSNLVLGGSLPAGFHWFLIVFVGIRGMRSLLGLCGVVILGLIALIWA